MKSIDVSSKLGEYNRNKRADEWISDNYEVTESTKVPKESIKLFNKIKGGDRKIGPIKAERILLK